MLFFGCAIAEFTHVNQGDSKSTGSRANGTLENAYLLPYDGANFKYFSPISYYWMDNAYCHSRLYHTVLQAYKTCQKTAKGTFFRFMEVANKTGGKMFLHRTHQQGLSIDFMVPKISGKEQTHFYDRLGLWHYLLNFDDKGALTANVKIDYEAMGNHILALDKAARKNGLKIKRVIFKLELKDDFYKSKSGRKVKNKGIYFAKNLSDTVNKFHDDHYHIDFELR